MLANGLSGYFDDIRSALQSKRTFYSFFKYDHGDHPGNIDMFIIDLERGRVYEIYLTTENKSRMINSLPALSRIRHDNSTINPEVGARCRQAVTSL